MKDKLKPVKKYQGMFKVQYPDNTWSKNFFSLTWAKEHLRRIYGPEQEPKKIGQLPFDTTVKAQERRKPDPRLLIDRVYKP